jgi:glutamate synthase (NADPH) small chain
MAESHVQEALAGFDYGQAMQEANRCLLCYDAPCSKACPAGTDPGAFIRKLRFRNITGAIRTVKENNILGGACGILCPTAELCEKECSATGIDRPIQIGKIQRFLVEHGYETGFRVFPKPEKKPQKIAVIGSGPAGLSCAAELSKEGYGVTVFEQFSEPGGVLRYGVPSHRFPRPLLDLEIGDIREMDVEFRCSTPIKGEQEAENLLRQGFSAVFIATGLWEAAKLREGQPAMQGVFSSLDFLKTMSEKKSDDLAEHIRGKRVAVIGGGSVAIDCAETALRLQARDVYLIYRRSYTEMPSRDDEKFSALREGIHFLILTRPVDYVTDAGDALKQMKLIRTELGEPDSSGRRRPLDVPHSEWLMDIDTVIEAIGQQAEKSSPAWYPSVKLKNGNLIVINEQTQETSKKSIFAGGDIVRGPALIVQAVWDGKVAARTIKERLQKEVLV